MQITGYAFHGRYGTARIFASISSAIGWMVVIVGVLFFVAGFQQLQQFGVFGILGGFFAIMAGLFQVQMGQSVRASLDSADYARQAFAIQLAQAQGLNEVNTSVGKPQKKLRTPAAAALKYLDA